MITAIYTAILAFMLAGLFINVVRVRRKHKVGLGHGGNPAVAKAVRAHGNFIETVPLVILMMAMLESMGIMTVILHGMGALLVFSRLLSMWGLAESTGTSMGRLFAGIITVLLFIAGGLLLLAGVFGL